MDFGKMAGLFMPMVKKMAEKGGFNSLNKSVEACNRRLAAMEVVGEAAGGLVRVTVNGDGKITHMSVPWEHKVMANSVVAQDLIVAATNSATAKAAARREAVQAEEMQSAMQAMMEEMMKGGGIGGLASMLGPGGFPGMGGKGGPSQR